MPSLSEFTHLKNQISESYLQVGKSPLIKAANGQIALLFGIGIANRVNNFALVFFVTGPVSAGDIMKDLDKKGINTSTYPIEVIQGALPEILMNNDNFLPPHSQILTDDKSTPSLKPGSTLILHGAGSIGCFVKDKVNNKICLLTNNHVIGSFQINSVPKKYDQTIPKTIHQKFSTTIYSIADKVLRGSPIICDLIFSGTQQNLVINSQIPTAGNNWNTAVANKIDASIATLKNQTQYQNLLSFKINNFFRYFKLSYKLFDESLSKPAVIKIGAASGMTKGKVETFNTDFILKTSNSLAKFSNQIVVKTNDKTNFLQDGDSGSIVFVDDFSNAVENYSKISTNPTIVNAIGLLFAKIIIKPEANSNTFVNWGIMNPINTVLEDLQIEFIP